MVPTIPKVSSTSVALPGADAPRDSGGRLTAEAATAWCTAFSPVVESLHRSACLKEVVRKQRLGIVGLVQNFCTLAGFGPYFVEASPGEWVPARDDDNAMVKLHKEFIAFMLSCMANGGLARRPDGELVLVGACCGAGFARAWLCLGDCATRSGRACEVRVLTPAARRAREAPKGGTLDYRSRPGGERQEHLREGVADGASRALSQGVGRAAF